MMNFKNKFNIGETIFHITPDSDQGVIVDIRYQFSTSAYWYTIAVGWDKEYTCREHEISTSKTF